MKRYLILLVSLAVIALLWMLLSPPQRTVYLGGPILTMDGNNRIVEALGVVGDRIGAVGSRVQVREWAGGSARLVDLGGRALLPGFIDAHGHFPGAGIYALHADLNSPPIGDIRTLSDIIERLARRAEQTSPGDWVIGMGYDDTLIAEKHHPTRADLDRASADHPIAIFHVSGHLASVNSRGLQEMGIDADTPDPEGGIIRRTPGSKEPDGVLEENAMAGVNTLLVPSLLDGIRITREASRMYLAAGVTTAQSGYTAGPMFQGILWMSRLGIIPLRLVIWPGGELADAHLEGKAELDSYDDQWAHIGAVKLIADGSIQGYTGYLSEPYHIAPGDDATYRGYPRIPREELRKQVEHYHRAGLQIAVHGNGDASIDDILDAYENALRLHPRPDPRHIVIHAQMARDDQLDRMKQLGVIPSFFSLHTYYWGDRHRDIFMGPVRAMRMSPARSAVDRGLRFTIHSDTPVVPMEPLRLVWSAVNRRSASGADMGATQRISPLQALRAVTIDAAFQHFEERDKGSLETGKLADLVILSRSPLDDPEHIDDIQVFETIIGGRTAYRGS